MWLRANGEGEEEEEPDEGDEGETTDGPNGSYGGVFKCEEPWNGGDDEEALPDDIPSSSCPFKPIAFVVHVMLDFFEQSEALFERLGLGSPSFFITLETSALPRTMGAWAI